MRPPKHPYKDYVIAPELLPGKEAGMRYWPNPVKGEARHYDQQSAYTIALRDPANNGVYCYGSHEDIIYNFGQVLASGTNRVTYNNAIEDAICWKITLPQRERGQVLQRLDRMNINAYTLLGCVPRFVEKERRPPLRHQGIRSGGNLRVFENLAQTLVAVDAP